MVDHSDIMEFVSSRMDELSEDFYQRINKPIHDNPEIAYDEYKAHEVLTTFFCQHQGWEVIKSAYDVPTAFVATFQYKATADTTVVSYNAEYDALPGIGHACGHNLIATSSVAAAILTAEAMVKFKIPGTVKLFGTPAEEGGGGKLAFIEAGAYKEVDCSVMVHPGANFPGSAWCHSTANNTFTCEFFGRAAHAAATPWEGINALDAQVIYYTCTSVLRQQLQPGDIIQGNILEGGLSPNVIANYTKNNVTVRAKSRKRLAELKERVLNCIKAAALATGCTYKTTEVMAYYDIISNDPMCDIFRKHFNALSLIDGAPLMESRERELITGDISASSDQGNVSYEVPVIHPMFAIDSPNASNHNEHFTVAAGTKDSHDKCLKAAKCMALTCIEVLKDKKLVKEIKEAWEADMEKHKPT